MWSMLNNIRLLLCQPWRLKNMFRILEITGFLAHTAIQAQVKWNWRIRLVPQNIFFPPPTTPLHLHRLFDHQWLCFFLTDIYYFFILQGVDPGLFNSQGIYPQPIAAPYVTGREVCQILIIFIHRLTIACNILHLFSFLMIVCSFLMCFSIWASIFLFIFKVQLYHILWQKDSLQWLLSQFKCGVLFFIIIIKISKHEIYCCWRLDYEILYGWLSQIFWFTIRKCIQILISDC